MDITQHLQLMIEKSASDLFLSVGAPITIKIDGQVQPVNDEIQRPGDVKKTAYSLMSDDQRKQFERDLELNMAISFGRIGRFRLNVFFQRGEVAMVIRYIKVDIPDMSALNLPPILADLIMEMRGLVLVVGATGSGKSTTLASMIDHRNVNSRSHILTIEDPIEYLYSHKNSIVNQREVGLDTRSYAEALKNAMREAPDVILIGEIREQETMQHALAYAETGHLCLSTLHANNANQAIDRIINFFPDGAQRQVYQDLSLNLRAIISQRLIPTTDDNLVPAVEILLNSPYISDLIEKGEIDAIKEVMERSADMGMCSFDQALFDLYLSGKINKDHAIQHADSRNNLTLKIRLHESGHMEGSDEFGICQNHYRE